MQENTETKKNTGLIAGIIGGAIAIIAIVIVIIVIAANSGAKLVGSWKATKMIEGNTTYTTEELEKYNLKAEITFNEDGTGTLKTGTDKEEEKFTYDKDKKTIKSDGESYNYAIDGKELTVKLSSSMSFVFEKQ